MGKGNNINNTYHKIAPYIIKHSGYVVTLKNFITKCNRAIAASTRRTSTKLVTTQKQMSTTVSYDTIHDFTF